MSNRADQALSFVADVVRNPVFKEEEVQRLRDQSIDAVRVALQDPLSIARYVAARVVFEDRPYGHAATGTPESLGRIARDHVVAFHKRHYRPNNAVLILAGDAETEQITAEVALLQADIDRWTALAALRRAVAVSVLP